MLKIMMKVTKFLIIFLAVLNFLCLLLIYNLIYSFVMLVFISKGLFNINLKFSLISFHKKSNMPTSNSK